MGFKTGFNEANSQYQVDTVQAHLEGLGYTCTQYPFSDSNDIAAVVQSAADNNDVLGEELPLPCALQAADGS